MFAKYAVQRIIDLFFCFPRNNFDVSSPKFKDQHHEELKTYPTTCHFDSNGKPNFFCEQWQRHGQENLI